MLIFFPKQIQTTHTRGKLRSWFGLFHTPIPSFLHRRFLDILLEDSIYIVILTRWIQPRIILSCPAFCMLPGRKVCPAWIFANILTDHYPKIMRKMYLLNTLLCSLLPGNHYTSLSKKLLSNTPSQPLSAQNGPPHPQFSQLQRPPHQSAPPLPS